MRGKSRMRRNSHAPVRLHSHENGLTAPRGQAAARTRVTAPMQHGHHHGHDLGLELPHAGEHAWERDKGMVSTARGIATRIAQPTRTKVHAHTVHIGSCAEITNKRTASHMYTDTAPVHAPTHLETACWTTGRWPSPCRAPGAGPRPLFVSGGGERAQDMLHISLTKGIARCCHRGCPPAS